MTTPPHATPTPATTQPPTTRAPAQPAEPTGQDWVTPPVDIKIRRLKVTIPSAQFSPVEYHFFSTPSYELEVEVPEGWSVERAIEHAHKQLGATREEDYEREARHFMEHAMQAIEQARAVPVSGAR